MGKLARAISLIALITSLPISANTIKIGIAGPFSGPYASFGEQMWQGALQATTDINQQSGVNGITLELIKVDDACEPKQAVTVANRLINLNEVKAIVGHFCSSSTLPASNVYADAQALMMTPASTNPIITERGLNTLFRICGRDDQQGFIAAEFIYHDLHAKKVAIIHDKDTYGKGLADATKARLEKLGTPIVLYEGLTRGEKDFNALVTKIKESQADTVYFGGMHPEAGPLLRQLRDQTEHINFVSGDGIVSKEFITTAGGPQMVKDVYMTFGSDPRKISDAQQIVEKFRKNNFEPEGYTLYSYAAIEAIYQALQATKSIEGKPLSDWLHQNEVHTVIGNKAWDKKGDLKTTDYIIYQWDENGTYKPYQKS